MFDEGVGIDSRRPGSFVVRYRRFGLRSRLYLTAFLRVRPPGVERRACWKSRMIFGKLGGCESFGDFGSIEVAGGLEVG